METKKHQIEKSLQELFENNSPKTLYQPIEIKYKCNGDEYHFFLPSPISNDDFYMNKCARNYLNQIGVVTSNAKLNYPLEAHGNKGVFLLQEQFFKREVLFEKVKKNTY